MADCCDEQGLAAVQFGGDVIVTACELTLAVDTGTEDEEALELEFELYTGWLDDEESVDVEFELYVSWLDEVLTGRLVVGYEVDAFAVIVTVLVFVEPPGEIDDTEEFAVIVKVEDVVVTAVELVVAFALAEVIYEQIARQRPWPQGPLPNHKR